MAIDLAKKTKAKVPLTCSIDGEQLNFEYRPGVLTVGFADELTEARGTGAYKMLPRLLASWDLENDGKKLPINEETILLVPRALLDAISQAIWDHQNPPATPETSSGSFS